MNGCPISRLRNRHKGKDIWVIASGPSAGYVDPDFFTNKITIGVNWVWQRFRCNYVVVKEHEALQAAVCDSQATVIASRRSAGSAQGQLAEADGPFYVFEHLPNQLTEMDLSVVGNGKIVVSYSTITSAMHVAAYLGAANILLVGHGCGTLDGQMNYPGYHESPFGPDFYRTWLREIEDQSVAVRAKLQEVYGVRIYSLNPFLNFGLEGHEYAR